MSGKTIIYVYNETKTGWKLEKTKDEGTKLITKPVRIKIDADTILEKKISIGVRSNIVEGDILERMIDTPRNKVAVCNYFGDNINVKFSNKTLDPYIKSSSNPKKQHVVLLLSLNLKSKKFVSYEQERSCILEYGFDAGNNEFNLIVSMDKTSNNPYFKLKIFDHKIKKVISYSFTLVNDKVKVQTEEIDEKVDTKKRTPIINKYRPKQPTRAIIVSEDDADELKDSLSKYRKPDKHISFIYRDEESLDELYKNLENNGYRAVTLFQGRGNGKATMINKEKIKRQFKTTLLLTSKGLSKL